MRVLHVIDSGGLYGAERVVLDLMHSQMKEGLSPMLLSIGNPTAGIKAIETVANTEGLVSTPLRFRNGLNLKGSMLVLQYARSLGVHIIHSHGYKTNILLGVIPKKIRKIPVVATVHGWTSSHFFSRMRFYEYLNSFCLKNLEIVVAVSSSMLEDSRLKMFCITTSVINNGIPSLNYSGGILLKRYRSLAEGFMDSFKILGIGRLSTEKGFDILILALSRLLANGVNAQLLIVGEGHARRSLEQLAYRLGISNRVHLPGYCHQAYELIPDFDVFVISSYTEGLPITLLEAMQAGVPSVATSVGEIPAVLENGNCGWIVPAGDANSLANTIKIIHDGREEAQRKVLLAKQRVLETYGVEKMARSYSEIYQSLIHDTRNTGNLN